MFITLTMLWFVFTLTSVLLTVIVGWYVWFYTSKWITLIERIPGPTPWPIVGNTLEVFQGHKVLLDKFANKWLKKYGEIYRIYINFRPHVVVTAPEYLETILTSSTLIEKGMIYDLMRPWLGDSLLVSAGQKWKWRRRLFTPAFHFKVLDNFVQTFNEHSVVLCRKLQEACHNTQVVDVYPLLNSCTLDIVCETAMGCKINTNLNYSEYINAIHRVAQIILERFSNPWMKIDWLFALTPLGREHEKCLNTLHTFADGIIRERREERNKSVKLEDDRSEMGIRSRRAFLDLLLEAVAAGAPLNDEDIRDEVNVFIFGGHDTTSSASSWFLYSMACNPAHQDKVRSELDEIFGDSDRPCTQEDVSAMKYLDCCIKESMRIYSSGPFIIREVTEPINIGGYDIPAGCDLTILIYGLHRNPRLFPDPEEFQPERFFHENCAGRHPFAYIPFSAGPRNCIGQKFAMLELKILLSTILRKFEFELPLDVPKPKPSWQLILKPKEGGIKLLVKERLFKL